MPRQSWGHLSRFLATTGTQQIESLKCPLSQQLKQPPSGTILDLKNADSLCFSMTQRSRPARQPEIFASLQQGQLRSDSGLQNQQQLPARQSPPNRPVKFQSTTPHHPPRFSATSFFADESSSENRFPGQMASPSVRRQTICEILLSESVFSSNRFREHNSSQRTPPNENTSEVSSNSECFPSICSGLE